MRHRLEGKVAIVTGGGSGIGRAIALAFAREGACVTVIGRREAKLEEVVRKIGNQKGLAIAGDVTDADFVQRVVEETADWFGSLTVLVNNAGVMIPGTVETHTEADFERMFNVNVRAVWLTSRAVLPHMRAAGGGSIVNISSVLGAVGAKNRVAYAASKGAVTMLTKCMALDHGHENIRVNCICPAFVETDLTASYVNASADPEAERERRRAALPIGRLGQPEDMAPIAVYLASDESKWVTGSEIMLDGGYTAG